MKRLPIGSHVLYCARRSSGPTSLGEEIPGRNLDRDHLEIGLSLASDLEVHPVSDMIYEGRTGGGRFETPAAEIGR